MTSKRELDQAAFDELLSWLDPNRKEATRQYETIYRGLLKILSHWGCNAAEEAADETVDRVAAKVPQLRNEYKGDPVRYFYGVAYNVFLEYRRKAQKQTTLNEQEHSHPNPEPTDEHAYDCMESCMQKLDPVDRELVLRYVEEDKPEQRKNLAKSQGITVNALRVRVFRILSTVRKCVYKCMQTESAEMKSPRFHSN
jgi:RNA polymerase sigma factor (sigma-70 family)